MKPLLSAVSRPSSVIAAAALLWGCAGFSDIQETRTFLESYAVGEYDAASAVVGGATGLDYPEGQLLSSLHTAMALRAAGRFEASQVAFDRAEAQLLWKSDSIASAEDLLSAGLTLVGNDLMASYRGTIYEGVLVNTYKATNALMIGDTARARVELNRAHQRQANAVDQLGAKVRALRAGQEEDEDEHRENIDRSLDAAMETAGAVARRLKAVESLGEYRDLRNPFTDWLHGVFRLATGEANRASDLLRNAAAMSSPTSLSRSEPQAARPRPVTACGLYTRTAPGPTSTSSGSTCRCSSPRSGSSSSPWRCPSCARAGRRRVRC